jgi:hypothetical protein
MGHLLKLKCSHSPLNQRILSSTSVPFTLTTVQVSNLALTHTKRFTVYAFVTDRFYSAYPLEKLNWIRPSGALWVFYTGLYSRHTHTHTQLTRQEFGPAQFRSRLSIGIYLTGRLLSI